jgi:putative ABC transport system substrate-binding protein
VRFALLVNPKATSSEALITDAQRAAVAIGKPIEVLAATTNLDIDSAFLSLSQRRADALFLGSQALFLTRRVQLATLAARHAVPATYSQREFAEVGGLMSYGSSIADRERQLGVYTGRILKGEKPADLPILRASKFEFVINCKPPRPSGSMRRVHSSPAPMR